MCQEIIPRINGSHKKTKPCRTHAVHAVKWKITKLFIRNINLAAINWSVDPLTSIYLYLICVYQIRMQRGKKKKQNGVGNLRFHCFLHTNQSLGVYGWQADRDIPSTASPQQDFRALCWPFLLNSDTKRMYKLGNQRIIKECHYNYQSLKASQQYSRLKFHIIYFIFKSPDICDPLSKYGGGVVYIEHQMLNSRHIVPTDSGKNSWESNATEAITNRKSQLCQISHFLVVSRILIKWSQLPV